MAWYDKAKSFVTGGGKLGSLATGNPLLYGNALGLGFGIQGIGKGLDFLGGLFGSPDLKRAKPPPSPIDNSKAYFEELAKAAIQRRLRESGGSAGAFKGQAMPSGTSLW